MQTKAGQNRPAFLQITLTERFGQDISNPDNIRKIPFGVVPDTEIHPKAKPMVAETQTSLRVVADTDSSKRRQIIDGARKVFLGLGFDGASMGEIAREAGVSKGTLYVYFADKNRLFEAIVEEESLEQGKLAFNFDPERHVTTTLMDFGQTYIAMLCRPGGGSATRTVVAIAARMPEAGRRFC